ncbi:hypothetical protein MKW94_006168, partial [Papaver nudicaule]|nr:hypothetical protein [Papaver nudicaule]
MAEVDRLYFSLFGAESNNATEDVAVEESKTALRTGKQHDFSEANIEAAVEKLCASYKRIED